MRSIEVLIAAPYPTLYSLRGEVTNRLSVDLHKGFLVHYKKIYRIKLVSKYILLCLVHQVDEVPRLLWTSRVACLVYIILFGLFSMR